MSEPMPHLQIELDKLKACIHCGMCLPTCPTYQATGSEAESPRGRLYLMKKMLEGELSEPAQLGVHLDQCLACHACETACPSGVQYGSLLMAAREDLAKKNHSPGRWLKRWAFQWVLPNHGLLNTLGRLLRFYQKSGLQQLVRPLLKPFGKLATQEALLPEIPKNRPLTPGLSFGNPMDERVALLVGCVMDTFYNPVHWATIDALVANGYYVTIPEQTCCGALAHHAGETDITRALARQNVRQMLKNDPAWIVVNSSGCGSTLKEYDHLLAEEGHMSAKAQVFAGKVVDIMELLARKPLATPAHPVEKTVTYHAACHLYHVQQVKEQPLDVLRQIPGLQLVPLKDASTCCGSAGIYNIEHPELSREILAEKITHLKATCEGAGAESVVTGNPGCLLQIEKGLEEAGLPLGVQHPVELVAEAYRRTH